MNHFRFLLLIGLLVGSLSRAVAATPAETRLLQSGAKLLEDRIYNTAEARFAELISKHPETEYRSQALLLQATARFYQGNLAGAIDLLQTNLVSAGNLSDQYQFWIAESLFQKGEHQRAADTYQELLTKHPASSRFLEASVNQAFAYSRLGDWRRVINLLVKPEGSFAVARSRAGDDNEWANRGLLLLAEALSMEQEFSESERILARLVGRPLRPEARWRQEFLLARVSFLNQKSAQALVATTNALQVARTTGVPRYLAETYALQGEILSGAGRWNEAIQVYEQNLTNSFPPEFRRDALLKITQFSIEQNKQAEAITRLERFLELHKNDAVNDIARFTLGELRLRQAFQPTTNAAVRSSVAGQPDLYLAITNFDRLISEHPASYLLGEAYLNRGWCLWLDLRYADAKRAFQEAVTRLPLSEPNAVARFKLGDCHFQLGEHGAAITNYQDLLTTYSAVNRVRTNLFEQTLYQLLRAGLAAGREDIATDALQRLTKAYPNTFTTDHGYLLVGQDMNQQGRPKEARQLFTTMLERFPNSTVVPEANLAIARTYIREGNWAEAAKVYDRWTGAFTNHPMTVSAEFSRALAHGYSGNESNAVAFFTSFVQRFPTNEMAARAYNWLGDHFYNREDYARAEGYYQLLYKNAQASGEFAFRGRMMAGRAAYQRQGFNEARSYYSEIVNNTNSPSMVAAEAWFALGDTIFQQFLENQSKPAGLRASEDFFGEAITAFEQVTTRFATNSLAALALGRQGHCYLQMGMITNDAKMFALAARAYSNLLATAQVPAIRNEAQVGLGKVFEKQGKADAALEQYLEVIYAGDTSLPDPYWAKQAGLAAAGMYETRGDFVRAANVYRRLIPLLPALKATLEKKLSDLRQQTGSS